MTIGYTLVSESQTREVENIHAKIARALADIPPIKMNRVNTVTKAGDQVAYADISAITAAVNPAFYKHSLFITQLAEVATETKFRYETVCYDDQGEMFSFGFTPWFTHTADPQSIGKSITYARRYGLVTALGLSAEDDDGESLKRMSTDWASDEQTKSLINEVLAQTKTKDSEDYVRWETWMIRSKYFVDGQIPEEQFKDAVAKTKDFLKSLEDSNE